DGLDSTDFGSVMLARINSLSGAGSAFEFGAPSGTSTASPFINAVTSVSPDHPMVARDFHVRLTQGTGPGTRVFGLMVGGSEVLGCVLRDNPPDNDTTCTNHGPSPVIPAGSTLALQAGTGPPPPPADALVGYRLTP